MKPIFQKMLVIGVGLIGGSLALASRRKGLIEKVYGMGRSADSLQRALDLGVIDGMPKDLKEGLDRTDLVVLGTPVGKFEEWARSLSQQVNEGLIVTDVGSVKGKLVIQLEEILKGKASFVGGHPIAGKEKSGVEASQESLFEGALCVLTPTPRTAPEALQKVKSLWEGVGSKVALVDPFVHDRLLAAVSHLPHMVAYALVNAVLDADIEGHDPISFSGGGFRDFTRISASSEEMWRDICLQNKEALVEMLEVYQEKIGDIKQLIINEDGEGLLQTFRRAKGVKKRIA